MASLRTASLSASRISIHFSNCRSDCRRLRIEQAAGGRQAWHSVTAAPNTANVLEVSAPGTAVRSSQPAGVLRASPDWEVLESISKWRNRCFRRGEPSDAVLAVMFFDWAKEKRRCEVPDPAGRVKKATREAISRGEGPTLQGSREPTAEPKSRISVRIFKIKY
jgi:hypothetical protein